MNCATIRPEHGHARRTRRRRTARPLRGTATSRPPATLPSRIATNVPISTMPLPPVSSARSAAAAGRRTSPGRTASNARPSGTAQAQQRQDVAGEEARRPPITMIAISRIFMKRISSRLLVLVGQLARGRREQHERQDEQRADHQPGLAGGSQLHRRWYATSMRERELEHVVVGGAEELRPEERREAALASRANWLGCGCASAWGAAPAITVLVFKRSSSRLCLPDSARNCAGFRLSNA